MNVQRFVQQAFERSLSIMGAEEIEIAGQKIPAVIDETASGNILGIGGIENQRTLVVKFPARQLPRRPRSGDIVRARGESWQISADSNSILIGQSAITLTLIEPNRTNGI